MFIYIVYHVLVLVLEVLRYWLLDTGTGTRVWYLVLVLVLVLVYWYTHPLSPLKKKGPYKKHTDLLTQNT